MKTKWCDGLLKYLYVYEKFLFLNTINCVLYEEYIKNITVSNDERRK